MGSNKRIAKNTMMMYVRMIGVMLVNLYASRLILQILGVTDYGIYNVVAGFVTMFAFLDVSISNAAQRYISIGLGKGQKELTKHYFEQSFTILFFMAVIMAVAAEVIGIWYINNKLVVPSNRLDATFWVFQFSIVTVICTILRISFLANIIAREELNAYAYISIFEAVARWLILYLLIALGGDSLIWYAFLIMVVSICCLIIYGLYCKTRYYECSLRFIYDKGLVKEMSSFIGLTTFGGFSYTVSNQGINLILNYFFGPVVNAARGIATQAASLVGKLNTSITVPVRPVLIKAYAEKDNAYVKALLYNSSKFTFSLLAIVSFALMAEMKLILSLWLVDVPQYAVNFCRLAVIDQLVLVLIAPLSSTANATGNIKSFELYGRLITLSSLPLSFLLLIQWCNPYIPMIVLFFCDVCYWLFCLRDITTQLELRLWEYTKTVILPCLAVCVVIAAISCCVMTFFHHGSVFRFVLFLATNSISGICCLYFLSSTEERMFYNKTFKRLIQKIKR